jgi:hypothetical protein
MDYKYYEKRKPKERVPKKYPSLFNSVNKKNGYFAIWSNEFPNVVGIFAAIILRNCSAKDKFPTADLTAFPLTHRQNFPVYPNLSE